MSRPLKVPAERIRPVNDAPVAADGSYVLYWMIANRRASWNYALDRAVEVARELGVPLVVLEPLRCGYRWANDRMHAFVLQGMADNEDAFADTGVLYHPYVEPEPGAGKGLLAKLAEGAACVVTDDFPTFFLPRMVAAAGRALAVRLEAVDSNGILPMYEPGRAFHRAFDFRRHLQDVLRPYLDVAPAERPAFSELAPRERMPAGIVERWPRAERALLEDPGPRLSAFPVDHAVPPAPFSGGSVAGREALERFVDARLADYGNDRNRPEEDGASGLSPWLHFGHVSAHEVLDAVAEREGWTPDRIRGSRKGARAGWWRASASAEEFLDQLVTWRELGFGFCAHREDHDTFDSLPEWARTTLEEHAGDRRPYLYTLEQFDRAETHDELWNAAQLQLRKEGRMHNYLRMLWGKKILHWSESPRAALDVMIELNNRYAVDGRDPNSYSGIFWVLGRFDRAWGPEREVFGKIRYMSSRNTRRKLRTDGYVRRWIPGQGSLAF